MGIGPRETRRAGQNAADQIVNAFCLIQAFLYLMICCASALPAAAHGGHGLLRNDDQVRCLRLFRPDREHGIDVFPCATGICAA